jgi:hypothetical protein
MKILQILSLAMLVLLVGCRDKKKSSCPIDKPAATASSGAVGRMQPDAPGFSGVVKETMNTAGYTYALVDTGNAKVWAVAPETVIKPGDTVTVFGTMPMKNYQSKTLHRTFELVFFAGSILRKGEKPAAAAAGVSAVPSPHAANAGAAVPMAKMDFSQIKKPVMGKTVAEIYAGRDNLAGKKVVCAAKVVKSFYGIMGKNWLHVQDGTGGSGTNDLTVTTDAAIPIGKTVLIEGVLEKDKDIGAGYKYSVIIENANVTVEK